MKKSLIILPFLVFAMAAPTMSFAQPGQGPGYEDDMDGPGRGRGRGRGRGMRRHLEEIQPPLSDKQKEKIKEMRKAHREQMEGQRKEMRSARLALEEAVNRQASDDELRKLHDKFHALRGEMGKSRFEMALAIRAELTDEQKKSFKLMRKDRRRGGRGMKGNW
jgi:Spy/CpxP family protein refolding chaperone